MLLTYNHIQLYQRHQLCQCCTELEDPDQVPITFKRQKQKTKISIVFNPKFQHCSIECLRLHLIRVIYCLFVCDIVFFLLLSVQYAVFMPFNKIECKR